MNITCRYNAKESGIHQKPIYGGRTISYHGYRKSNRLNVSERMDCLPVVNIGAAQDMDLLLNTRFLSPVFGGLFFLLLAFYFFLFTIHYSLFTALGFYG